MVNQRNSSSYSIFQLEVERILKNISFKFLDNYYGEQIKYVYDYNKIILHYKRGRTLSGVYIEIYPNGLDIYKTDKENKINNLRHMYGFYNGENTVSTGKTICDTDEEYILMNKYLVEPIYNTILKGRDYEEIVQLIDNSEVHRVTQVRESNYKVNQNNKRKLYNYLKKLTATLIQEGELDEVYHFAEVFHPYISLSNYYNNVSSEFTIINSKGERIILISYNDRNKGIKYVSNEDLFDDYLYELMNVLDEVRIQSNFMPVHEKLIKERIVKYLQHYKEEVPVKKGKPKQVKGKGKESKNKVKRIKQVRKPKPSEPLKKRRVRKPKKRRRIKE